MIKRESKYYTAGYKVANPEIAPFYLRALVFDGKEGDFNDAAIKIGHKIGQFIIDAGNSRENDG